METAIDEIIDIADNGFSNASALVTQSALMKFEVNIGYAVARLINNKDIFIPEIKYFINAADPKHRNYNRF